MVPQSQQAVVLQMVIENAGSNDLLDSGCSQQQVQPRPAADVEDICTARSSLEILDDRQKNLCMQYGMLHNCKAVKTRADCMVMQA